LLAKYRNYLLLHLTVFLYGFTGILGKLITISAEHLVWHRLWIAVLALVVYCLLRGVSLKVGREDLIKYCGVGLLIAAHWVFFYKAIKEGSVSVAVVCLSTSTFFTALIEPFFFKRRINWVEVMLGFVIFIVLYLIFFDQQQYMLGIVYGVIAAFLASVFPVFNGMLAKSHQPVRLTVYELGGGFVFLSLYLLLSSDFDSLFVALDFANWFWLTVLALACTAFTFVIGVEIMKEISPYTVVLSINLEPVYTIILAYFIFQDAERLNTGFYSGTLAILCCIFLNAYLKAYQRKRNAPSSLEPGI
jgi:drug/metabolite transporter (DMT)-like permease